MVKFLVLAFLFSNTILKIKRHQLCYRITNSIDRITKYTRKIYSLPRPRHETDLRTERNYAQHFLVTFKYDIIPRRKISLLQQEEETPQIL